MAELGAIASGMGIASLTIQLGSSIIKLKGIWSAIKDAPEEISYLMEEIETLSLVLADIEDGTTAHDGGVELVHSAAATRCLELCRRGVDILETVVRDLNAEMMKNKRLGGFKAVLRKGTLDRARERLKSAQVMLMMSHQTYLGVLQKQQHDLQREWSSLHAKELLNMKQSISQTSDMVSLTLTHISSPGMKTCRVSAAVEGLEEDDVQTLTKLKQAKQRYGITSASLRRHEMFKLRLQTPKLLWARRRVFEFLGYNAPSGWDAVIRVYNIVPCWSDIFIAAWNGDIAKVQRLFQDKEASPFDRDELGYTLLDTSALARQAGVCKLLVMQGADPNVSCKDSSLEFALYEGTANSSCPSSTTQDILRCLLPVCEPDGMLGLPKLSYQAIDLSLNNFTLLLSESTYHEQRLNECVKFAIECLYPYHIEFAAMVRILLDGRVLDVSSSLTCGHLVSGETLLHAVAQNLGWKVAASNASVRWSLKSYLVEGTYSDNSNIQVFLDSKALIADIVREPSTLHIIAYTYNEPCTPLLWLLLTADRRETFAAEVWLHFLKAAGVDLTNYGMQETEIHVLQPVQKEWTSSYNDRKGFCRSRLISFTYGNEVSDWRLWITPAFESWFWEFWDMVDHPERAIPGSWEVKQSSWNDYDWPKDWDER